MINGDKDWDLTQVDRSYKAPEPTGDDKANFVHEAKYGRETIEGKLRRGTITDDEAEEMLREVAEPQAPDAIEVELPPLSPCAVADAANGYFEDALEQREGQLKAEIVAKNALEALQGVHLTALRIVSAALGHPYKNERGKSCIDLANYAAKEIGTLHERSEKAEKERAAALLYGKNRKRDQLKAEMDELRKRYENITVERDDAEVERDRLSAELSELRKEGTFNEGVEAAAVEAQRFHFNATVANSIRQLKRTPPKK